MNKQTKWAKYHTEAGEQVPSVTTIIGRFKDSGGLIFWAFKEGCQQGQEKAANPQLSFDLYRDKAAEAGTMAHDMVEAHIKGLPLPELEGSKETIGAGTSAVETLSGIFTSLVIELSFIKLSTSVILSVYLDVTNIFWYRDWETDRKSTRLNSSHSAKSRMPSSA